MSFEAGEYLVSIGMVHPGQSSSRTPLARDEATRLSHKLASDSQKLIYSSLISIANAIFDIEKSYSSWPIVKLYYSAFYAVRSILALSDICIYHANGKGLWIESIFGANPIKPPKSARGSTHKTVFLVYEQKFPNSPLLSQEIEGFAPFDWLMQKREDTNYKTARFVEPNDNPIFKYANMHGIRRLCSEYINDDSFAFDPDHAILAYPFFLLNHIKRLGVRGNSCVYSHEENRHYEGYFCDKFGTIKPLLDLKRSLIL